jgi:hypothetical protein
MNAFLLGMNNCPFKAIVNQSIINGIQDSTFINSVLQAFSAIKCISQQWYIYLHNNRLVLLNNNKSSITKEVYRLLFLLYTRQLPDSSNVILHFINKLNAHYNTQIQQDPYHFLFYFLDLLHLENNFASNPNYNLNILQIQSLDNKRNNIYMYNLFCNFFQQTQNSIFSQFFTNIMKNEIFCEYCQSIYYYTFNNIIKFDVDDYRKYRDEAFPQKTCMNLNMDECFTCFIGGRTKKCDICSNFNAKQYTTLVTPAKVLILAFKRNMHNFNCDIDFEKKLNITKYIAKEHLTGINSNTNYELKSCISLNSTKQYFSDICINNCWFRFLPNGVMMLGNVKNDIHVFEPQLLIYELEEMKNNQVQQMIFKQMMLNQEMQKRQLQMIGAMNMMQQNQMFNQGTKN